MVKVECDGCKSPYQIDERRIPPAGLKMRCPKCGKSLLVTKEGVKPGAAATLAAAAVSAATSAERPPENDLPATAPAKRDRPSATSADAQKTAPKRPAAAAPPPAAFDEDLPALPAKASPRADAGSPPRAIPGKPASKPARSASPMPSFGDLDAIADLPAAPVKPSAIEAVSFDDDLPAVPEREKGRASASVPKPQRSEPKGREAAPAGRAGASLEAPAAPAPKWPAPPTDDDLPALSERSKERAASARRDSFGMIDLLPVAREAGVPERSGREAVLPAAAKAPPKKEQAAFGDLDMALGPGSDFIERAPVGKAGAKPLPARSASARAGGGIGRPSPQDKPTRPDLALWESDPIEEMAPARRSPPSFAIEDAFDLPRDSFDSEAPPGVAAKRRSDPGEPAPSLERWSDPDLSAPSFDRKSAPGPLSPAAARKSSPELRAAAAAPSPPPAGNVAGFDLLLSDAGRVSSSPAPPVGPPHEHARPMDLDIDLADAPTGLMGVGLDSEPATVPVFSPAEHFERGERGAAYARDTAGSAASPQSSAAIDFAPGGSKDAGIPAPTSRWAKGSVEEEAPPKKRTLVRAVLLTGLVVIGGSALTLFPDIGAFGSSFISDRITASSKAAALTELRQSVQADLDADTSAAAAAAFSRARAAHLATPRHRPTAAYAAYVAFGRSLRFGRRSADEAFARQLIAQASDVQSDTLALAMAAQDAVGGQLDRARQAASALVEQSPLDLDAAVLAAEIELGAKAHDKALAAWKRAIEIKKSARTLYGRARAELASGDLAGAEASARETIAASPAHAGARTLLASVLQQKGAGASDEEALALLVKVTSDGDVKSAASDAELVDANALLGSMYLAKSRMTAAEQAFAAALRADPQSIKALLGSGELFYRAGRFTEAFGRFEAAMRADPQSGPAKVAAAKTLLALERAKEAKDLLARVRQDSPKEALVAYWQGRVEEALGNKKDAEALYLETITLGENRPEVVLAYVALSRLLGSVGRAEDAAAKLVEASAKFPDLPALHRAKGELALQAGRYEEAKTELEAALAREDDLGTRFRLGVTLRRMRAFPEATAIFDKIAEADQDYPGLAIERGLLFEEMGQSDKALEMYAAALKKAPDDLDLKLRVGSTQVIAGRAKQAEPILREVIRQRAGSAEANHFLGRALLMKGTASAEAMRYLERSVEIDPNRAEYFVYVAWAANEAGQPARAETAVKRALELDRELGDAYWQRGVLLQKQGAIVDALADLQTALQKRPSRYEAYATMALCFQDQGKWIEAEDAWRRAIAANDTMPEWHYRLGKIYYTRGNRVGAAAELERAITLAEAADRSPSGWLFDAHFLLAEAMRLSGNREKAIKHYRRYLETAPADNAYRPDAERALAQLTAALPPPALPPPALPPSPPR